MLPGAILHCSNTGPRTCFTRFTKPSATSWSRLPISRKPHPSSIAIRCRPSAQNPFAQRVSASYDLMYRLCKDYEKPEFDIKTVDVDGVDVAIHERVEVDKPFCELRRFKRFTDDPDTLTTLKGQPAVLIVAPLSGHYATLLRDTVRTMLQGPQGLHHRLEERPHRAAGARRVPPGRLRQLRAGIHPPRAGRIRQLPRHQRVPAHGAGAGRRVADGQRAAKSRR